MPAQKRVALAFFVAVIVACLIFYATQGKAREPALLFDEGQTKDLVFSFPVEMRNGLPTATIKLGNDVVTVIVDTGSFHLNVSHSSCTTCDSKVGLYRGDLKNAASRRVIRYGSQEDTVVALRDVLSIASNARKELSINGVPVDFFTTVQRKQGDAGASNLNVFGLNWQTRRGVAPRLMPQHYTLVVSLQQNNKFVAGASPQYARQLRDKQTYQQAALRTMGSLPYYTVGVRHIIVRCNDSQWKDTSVRRLIIDTGSNMLSLPTSLADRMVSSTSNCLKPQVDIVFDSGAVLSLMRRHLFWNGGSAPMVDGDAGSTAGLEPTTAVLGSIALTGRTIHLDNKHFYFSNLI